MIHKTPNPSMRSKISEQSELAKFCFDTDLGLAPGRQLEGAQLNRCVENWSRQYEGSEANNEGSAWIFPNTAFVPPPARTLVGPYFQPQIFKCSTTFIANMKDNWECDTNLVGPHFLPQIFKYSTAFIANMNDNQKCKYKY